MQKLSLPKKTSLKRPVSKSRKTRNQQGIQLVEMLVAILMLSLLTGSILEALSKCSISTTASQNQILASNIAQQIIDTARNSGWAVMSSPAVADGTWHNINVYGSNGGGFLLRPLLNTGESAAGAANQFHGSARQQVIDLGNGSLQLNVEVSWPAENSAGTRMLQASSYINQFGVHN